MNRIIVISSFTHLIEYQNPKKSRATSKMFMDLDSETAKEEDHSGHHTKCNISSATRRHKASCLQFRHTYPCIPSRPWVVVSALASWAVLVVVWVSAFCQEVCPWNRNPPGLSIDEFAPKKEITELSFSGISTMTEEQFDRVFHDTAVKRSGLSKLMRNMEFISKREPNGE